MGGGYDFIYGAEVEVECQAQINLNPWKGDDVDYIKYLRIIKKDDDSFKNWCHLKRDIICMVKEPPIEPLDEEVMRTIKIGTQKDDYFDERSRATCWTNEERKPKKGKFPHLGGSGHGKQLLILKCETYCARYLGPGFTIPEYSST